jgi:hypothetical protein
MKTHVALDSGAHSIFNKFLAARTDTGGYVKGTHARINAKYDFYESEKFLTYLDKFVQYAKANASKFDFVVTLDAIFNPEKTWEIWEYLLGEGLNVMPVLHYGEPLSYLKKMLERTDYVGIGGLGQDITREKFLEFGDGVFKYLGGEKTKIKTHGFAMTAFDLLMRYPWFSVDSTTPFTFARTGALMMPKSHYRGGLWELDFLTVPYIFPVTDRRTTHPKHVHNITDLHRNAIHAWLDYVGITLKEAEEYEARDIANIVFMDRVQQAIQEKKGRPFRFYASGKPSAADHKFPSLMEGLKRCNVKNFYYLGTYFLVKPTIVLLNYLENTGNGKRSARPLLKARSAGAGIR